MSIMPELINKATGKYKNEQDREVSQIQHEMHDMEGHDIMSHAHELDIATKALYGVLVQLLQREEEATGIPNALYLYVFQTSAVQGTFYPTQHSTVDGVVRGIFIGGTGNITLRLYGSNYSPNGYITIGTFPCGGNGLFIPFRFPIHHQNYFQASTDVSSSGVVSISAYCEPAVLTGKDMFSLNNQVGQ